MKKKLLVDAALLAIFLLDARMTYTAFRQWQDRSFHAKLPCTVNLVSSAFSQNGFMPRELTAQGAEQSPPLAWSGLPEGTRSLALLASDDDAPSPLLRLFTIDHWVLYNIPVTLPELFQGTKAASLKAENISLGRTVTNGPEYVGPNPPFGIHRYRFRLYALSVPRIAIANPDRKALLAAMRGHILAYGELDGYYRK